MIKLCYITTVPITIETFIMDCAKYLMSTNDYDITFVCDYNEEFAKKVPANIKYHPIKMARGISLGGFKATYQMYKFLKKEKFDIVQYSTPNASCYASIASRMARIPVRLYCQWGIAYVGFSGIKRKIFKLLEKLTCLNSTVIEPDSYGNLNFSNHEGLYSLNKGHVVGSGSASGVSFDKFDISKKEEWKKEYSEKYNICDSHFVYGFVGRIDKDKGFNELLDAYYQVKDENTKLIIVGPDDKNDTVDQELLNKAKNDESVIFTGRTSTVEKYLSIMNVFILPSYREGFGSVVIEAQSMGVPVIVSNIPGPTDAMDTSTGLIVKVKDSNDLAKAMDKLKKDRNLLNELSKNCVSFAKKFDNKILFDLIDQDRKSLINSHDNK